MQRLRHFFIVILCLALCGCNTVTLRDDLTQDQAGEIVAELVSRGISAVVEKETGGRGKYRVEVRRSSYSEGMALLHELGLPSAPRSSFGEMVAQRGLMPDSREVEALRIDRALAAELEETLQNHPGISQARVVVRLNSASSELFGGSASGGVSGIVRVRQGSVVLEEDVKSLLAQGLPGISADQIKVQLYNDAPGGSPSESNAPGASSGVVSISQGLERDLYGAIRKVPLTQFLWFWRVPDDEYDSLAGGILLGVVLVFGFGILIGHALMAARVAAQTPSQGLSSQKRLPQARPERAKRELPEPPKEGA
jgi:type III secretory pathway lipoprotein EscJ